MCIKTNMNELNVKLRFVFLSDEDADYVGMAKTYRTYLTDNEDYRKQRIK